MSTPPVRPGGRDAVAARVDERVEQQVEERVEQQVEERVEEVVEERLDEVVEQAENAAGTAEVAAADAEGAAGSAQGAAATSQRARDSAVQAGTAAVEAAAVVAPDDPLLDTAIRKIEARVDEANPYGRVGRPIDRRSPLHIGFMAALGVALAYGLVQAVVSVRGVLVLVLISAFLAAGLDPAVRWLERRGNSRSYSVGVVLLAALLAFVGFCLAVVPPIVDQAQEFIEAVPGYVEDLQSNPRIAELDQRYGVLEQVQGVLEDPALGGTVFGGVLGVGRLVVSAFFNALTVLILTLYFLANLPTIKANAYRLVPRSRRARVGLLTDEILTRVGGYVAGALTIAAIAGASSFVLLLAIGVPYPLALALLVALTDLVPLVGATIGAAIITLVAFSVSLQVGIIAALWYLAYQQLENYLLYPKIMKRSVDVSPAATIVAVLIGGALLGVVGALLAIPLAAAVQLVLQEVVEPRQDRS